MLNNNLNGMKHFLSSKFCQGSRCLFLLLLVNLSPLDADADSTNEYSANSSDIKAAAQAYELTSEEERQLTAQANGFAFRLFRQTRGDDSQVLSPLGVTFALSMLNNGTAGQTRQEISQALGFGNASLDAVNAFCRKQLTKGNTLDPLACMPLASSVWVNQPSQLLPDFKKTAADYFDATAESRNFTDGQTLAAINRWGSSHTNGMIPSVLESLSPSDVSYLLNAVYFKGTWTLKFDPAKTKKEAFGSTGMTLPMMYQHKRVFYKEDATCQALRLPYGNESFCMTVFLPREDKTIGEVLTLLESGQWDDRYRQMEVNEVDVKLPQMDQTTSLPLNDAVQALGIKRAFDAGLAEFPLFCSQNTYLYMLKQDVRLKVDEEGTSAQTISGGTIVFDPPVYTFHANRPFLYVISEKSSGLIYFIGQMTDGTPTDIPASISATPVSHPSASTLYDLLGRPIQGTPQPGLYIREGKKIMVK